MKSVAWMAAACVASAFLLTRAPGIDAAREIWLGMAGPLLMAGVGWIVAERAHRRDPERMIRVQLWLFGGKMAFVAAYLVAMLLVGALRPAPFVASFTGYFLSLHAAEAYGLQRLLRQRPGGADREPID